MRSTLATILAAGSALVSSTPILGSRQSQSLGRINFDALYPTCHGREQEVIKAFTDMHLLTDAAKGISSDDGAFKDYFGIGWDNKQNLKNFLPNIEANIQKAAGIVDGSTPGPTIYLTCEVLPGSCSQARTAATTIQSSKDVPRIVLCPFLFDTSENGAHLPHVTDITPLDHATTNGKQARTWEHIVLHELMHIESAGYTTLLSIDGADNKIIDVKHQLDNLDPNAYPVYGSTACYRYAQFRSPPKYAPSNADSYAWLATAKYFRNVWGTRVTRAFEDDEYTIGGQEDEGDFQDPEGFCASQSQPEKADCAAIDVANDFNNINLDSGYPCYSNGNRNWCDIYTEGTCQITIGWDSNDGKPSISNNDLSNMVSANMAHDQCTGHVEDKPKVCAIAQGVPTSLCSQPWKFCMKRVGVDCT